MKPTELVNQSVIADEADRTIYRFLQDLEARGAEIVFPGEDKRVVDVELLIDCRNYIGSTISTHEELSEMIGWCECGYCTHVPSIKPDTGSEDV